MKKNLNSPRAVARILTIGDELLKGTVLNTNARFLGTELLRLGFKVDSQISCPDDIGYVKTEFGRALSAAELVIVTGGLGPTPDDITRDALSEFFRAPLILSKRQISFIQNYYKSRGKKMPALVCKEALFPQNAEPLFNRYGIALGFSIEVGERLVIVLPGVPSEMERMFHELVVPLIKKKFPDLSSRHSLIVKTVGIGEPEVMKRLREDFFDVPFEFGIYPMVGEVTLRLYSDSLAIKRRLEKKVRTRLKKWVYAYEESTLPEVVGQLLRKQKKTLAAAESCTGGLLASKITAIPGSSDYFKGGLTAYSNDVKVNSLEVPKKVISQKGAVSAETARWMASQIRLKMKTFFGIGITGIAGPTGGTKSKPVGLVYLSISSQGRQRVWKEIFHGSRLQIQSRAVQRVLEHLWQEIR